jgi:predicted DNA-binding antitoxin AbrB/MazE fold protein
MTTPVKAIYEDGVFKPLEPLQLIERTQVEVLIPSAETPDADNTGELSAIDDIIGLIRNAPADMAEHHDRYLYRQPRE